jgi:hypothetical protein
MKAPIVIALALGFGLALQGGSVGAAKKQADQCYVEVHTNLYGNAAVPCEYRFTMLVNADGTISSSSGGTRFCEGAGFFGLGAGRGAVGAPSSIDFPFIADITFDLPSKHDAGEWVLGLVHSLSDRGGSSPVTSSQMICSEAPR